MFEINYSAASVHPSFGRIIAYGKIPGAIVWHMGGLSDDTHVIRSSAEGDRIVFHLSDSFLCDEKGGNNTLDINLFIIEKVLETARINFDMGNSEQVQFDDELRTVTVIANA